MADIEKLQSSLLAVEARVRLKLTDAYGAHDAILDALIFIQAVAAVHHTLIVDAVAKTKRYADFSHD